MKITMRIMDCLAVLFILPSLVLARILFVNGFPFNGISMLSIFFLMPIIATILWLSFSLLAHYKPALTTKENVILLVLIVCLMWFFGLPTLYIFTL